MTDHIVSFFFPFPETREVATVDLAHRRRGLVATGKREHGVVLLTYDDSAFARSSLLLAGETDRLKLRFIAKPRSEVSWSFEVISPSAIPSLASNQTKWDSILRFPSLPVSN